MVGKEWTENHDVAGSTAAAGRKHGQILVPHILLCLCSVQSPCPWNDDPYSCHVLSSQLSHLGNNLTDTYRDVLAG